MVSTTGGSCAASLAVRGNPELEARRDKLVVSSLITYYTLVTSHISPPNSLLGPASITRTSGPCALTTATLSWISIPYQRAMP